MNDGGKINEFLQVGLEAAQGGAKIIFDALNQPRTPNFKGRTDLVTETDRRSEDWIISTLLKEFPEHGILAEESGNQNSDSEYLWVIDPLDGTTNFVHGYPAFAVSIGLLIHEVLSLGIIIELPANKIFSATIGMGAFLDGSPLRVSTTHDLEKSLLVTGFGYNHGEKWKTNLKLHQEFTDRTQGVRRSGSAAVDFCHVARGILDGFWEFDLHPWDSAAGVLIVQEAGGRVSGMDGAPYSIFQKHVLATNGNLHPAILEHTNPAVAELIKKNAL